MSEPRELTADEKSRVAETSDTDPRKPGSNVSVNRNINESADKVRLETKIKRGEGTRDQDEIKIQIKGDDPEEAAQTLHDTVVAVGKLGTVNALRGTQPTGASDD